MTCYTRINDLSLTQAPHLRRSLIPSLQAWDLRDAPAKAAGLKPSRSALCSPGGRRRRRRRPPYRGGEAYPYTALGFVCLEKACQNSDRLHLHLRLPPFVLRVVLVVVVRVRLSVIVVVIVVDVVVGVDVVLGGDETPQGPPPQLAEHRCGAVQARLQQTR